MIDAAVAAWGRLDILVNNAGVMGDMAPIAEVSDEKFRQVMDVSVYGPMAAMRKAVQVFLEQGQGGNIINVSSVSASHQAASPIYGASKAALNAMSRNTTYMYKGEKIRVNVIAPGGINTEIATAMGRPNMDGYTRLGPVLKLSPAPAKPRILPSVPCSWQVTIPPISAATSLRWTADGLHSESGAV